MPFTPDQISAFECFMNVRVDLASSPRRHQPALLVDSCNKFSGKVKDRGRSVDGVKIEGATGLVFDVRELLKEHLHDVYSVDADPNKDLAGFLREITEFDKWERTVTIFRPEDPNRPVVSRVYTHPEKPPAPSPFIKIVLSLSFNWNAVLKK